MPRILFASFFLILAGTLATCGCGGGTAQQVPSSASFQVVTVSDLHFFPLYDTSLYPALVAADPSQWAGIFHGSMQAAPAPAGADTNYPLLVLTLASMKQQMGTSPVVLFTGDLLGHNIPSTFFTQYYGTPNYSGPDATATAAMQQFMDKTVTFVAGQIRLAAGSAPVMYVVGNIDTYSGGIGPDATFLVNNAGTIYTQFVNDSADQQTFLSTFTSDGYYSAQPLGSKLLVIGLNTNSFVAGAPSNSSANTELQWLDLQLAAAQAARQKVWILMHVPPGVNSQVTASNAANAGTPNQVNETTTSMNWDAGYQATFLLTLARYPGLVTLMLAGHTHMDEYRILPTGNVVEHLSSISPCFGNNPAYKVFTIVQDTLLATDYESFDYDLSGKPAEANFLYKLSAVYRTHGPMDVTLALLYPQLIGSPSPNAAYTYYYASGSLAGNPETEAPWNPINSVNWPIFACTIGNMDEPGYRHCVNTF